MTTQRVGEIRNGKKLIGFNVYHAPEGCAEVFLGFAKNLREAQSLVGKGGLAQSDYGTARAAGHCAGMHAPDKSGEGKEPWEWLGDDTCAMPVFREIDRTTKG